MSNKIVEQDYDIEIIETNKIKPYRNNPRKLNTNAVESVKKSIKQNRFSSVIIVDKDYEIIAGHTRHAAATELGIKKLPVFIAKTLEPEKVRSLRLLDNRLTEITPWDLEKLSSEMQTVTLDEDFTKLFEPLLVEDLSEFDLSDDAYTPAEDEQYTSAIIQYVMIFDNDEQQNTFYSFLAKLKEKYPDDEEYPTHSSRMHQHLKEWLNGT
jgi:hypothetical protein